RRLRGTWSSASNTLMSAFGPVASSSGHLRSEGRTVRVGMAGVGRGEGTPLFHPAWVLQITRRPADYAPAREAATGPDRSAPTKRETSRPGTPEQFACVRLTLCYLVARTDRPRGPPRGAHTRPEGGTYGGLATAGEGGPAGGRAH